MKQKLILFSALLIISFLAGTACAVGESENTEDELVLATGPSVSIAYNETGHFKMGDIIKITATFSEPVYSAVAMVGNSVITPTSYNMSNISDTVWTFDYEVPADINDAVDVTVSGFSVNGPIEKTDSDAFVIDNEAPRFKRIQPVSDYVNTKNVVFEFSAFDKLDNTIAYAIYINGTEKKTGTISSNGNAKYEIEKPDGYYQWEVKLKDDAGNVYDPDPFDLYVDTKDPYVTLVSPEDLFVCTPTSPLFFNFTCQDTLCEEYNMELYYELYIDGEPFNGFNGIDYSGDNCSGYMTSGDYINIQNISLNDGAHNWSVYSEDKAENNCSDKVRNFYVNNEGLEVELISPDGGFVPGNPDFNFSVSGGAGLPFSYELIINDTKVKNGTLFIGEDGVSECSVNAKVADGIRIPWTVRVTDCAGATYEPDPLYFSVDSIAPAAVANLSVTDALSDTTWYYIYDEPGLYVSWDKNTEEDLHDGAGLPYNLPYVVFISDCKPSSIEEMEVAVPYSSIYDTEDGKSLCMNISTYGGEPLVYGKDYWVAVIALDRAGNYADCFAVCGPVHTYEDMDITLNEGWNLKSVPKRLATFNADTCSVFGKDSTVIYWNGSCWEFPKTIEPCKGYWVYTPKACETNVKFKPMPTDSASPDVPPSLYLASGWQMIGHTSTQPVGWPQTLGSLQGLLGAEYKFSNLITYSQNEGWGGTISLGVLDLVSQSDETAYPVDALESSGVMVPGQGYWVFMKEDGTYASVESVEFYDGEPV